MQVTLENMIDRLNIDYKGDIKALCEGESVIKGSVFPRCFPYIFRVGGVDFVLSTQSRLNGKSYKEVDMNSDISKQRDCVRKKYFVKKDNIIVDNFSQYPLILASFTKDTSNELNHLALIEAQKYIKHIINLINKYEKLCFSEEEIIAFLTDDKNNLLQFSKDLAIKIDEELAYIKKENKETFDSFVYTKKFLSHFNTTNFNTTKGEL